MPDAIARNIYMQACGARHRPLLLTSVPPEETKSTEVRGEPETRKDLWRVATWPTHVRMVFAHGLSNAPYVLGRADRTLSYCRVLTLGLRVVRRDDM